RSFGVSCWRRDGAELDEHSQTIRDAPVLDDAAAADAKHVENVDSEGPTSRRTTHVRAVVRARRDVAHPDRIPGDDHLLDLALDGGDPAPHGRHDRLAPGGARLVAGAVVLMLHDLVGDELIADVLGCPG